MKCPSCGEGEVYLHRVHRFTKVGAFLGTLLLVLGLLALMSGALTLPRMLGEDPPAAENRIQELGDEHGKDVLLGGAGGVVLGILLRSTRRYRRCDACGKKV